MLKWLLPEKNKGYDINFKLKAVEYAEMNSNEKDAKKFRVLLFILRKRPIQQELINAGSRGFTVLVFLYVFFLFLWDFF